MVTGVSRKTIVRVRASETTALGRNQNGKNTAHESLITMSLAGKKQKRKKNKKNMHVSKWQTITQLMIACSSLCTSTPEQPTMLAILVQCRVNLRVGLLVNILRVFFFQIAKERRILPANNVWNHSQDKGPDWRILAWAKPRSGTRAMMQADQHHSSWLRLRFIQQKASSKFVSFLVHGIDRHSGPKVTTREHLHVAPLKWG